MLLKALNPEIRLKPIEAARGWGGRTRAIAWLCRRAGFGIPDLSAWRADSVFGQSPFRTKLWRKNAARASLREAGWDGCEVQRARQIFLANHAHQVQRNRPRTHAILLPS